MGGGFTDAYPTWLDTASAADLSDVGNSSEAKVSPTAQAPEQPSLPTTANSTWRGEGRNRGRKGTRLAPWERHQVQGGLV